MFPFYKQKKSQPHFLYNKNKQKKKGRRHMNGKKKIADKETG